MQNNDLSSNGVYVSAVKEYSLVALP